MMLWLTTIICRATTFVLTLTTVDSSAQARKRSKQRIIRRVDHILIRASDPETLFSFLTEALHLPVAWPIATYSHFTSGGVGMGNVNVEVIRWNTQPGGVTAQSMNAYFSGCALEPYPLADSLSELAARAIAYDAPAPYITPRSDGSQETLWTTVGLSQFSNRTMGIFLCEYNPSFVNVVSNRKRLKDELRSKQGGPLGILSVQEIILGVKDLESDKSRWQNLLRPLLPTATAVWQIGNGPAIRFVAAPEDQIQALVLRIASLKRAKAFLQTQGMLGAASDNALLIDPSNVQGLQIRLTERT